jgi:hypothetical protein
LIGIELSGVEDRRVGSAVAPFAVEEGVGGEMDDDAELKILPVSLLR